MLPMPTLLVASTITTTETGDRQQLWAGAGDALVMMAMAAKNASTGEEEVEPEE